MSSHIVHRPRVRLEQKATCGKGMGLHEAVQAATARVECLRADALARITELMAGLADVRQAMIMEPAALVTSKARSLADELAGLCGPFGLIELGNVAANLCRLADVDEPSGNRLAAVRVALDIVHLFATTDLGAHADLASKVLPEIERLTHSLAAGISADRDLLGTKASLGR